METKENIFMEGKSKKTNHTQDANPSLQCLNPTYTHYFKGFYVVHNDPTERHREAFSNLMYLLTGKLLKNGKIKLCFLI